MSGVPRHLVVTALDALGDGDQALAVEVLVAALEEGESRPGLGPPTCPTCGAKAWPGQLERHVWSVHRRAEATRAAA